MSQGRKTPPEPSLFVMSTDLYRHIPRSNFYERLAQVLDLAFIYPLTAPLYAPVLGRPSLDPVVFFKCMFVGFFENIVYDAELEYRLADSLTLRRFLGYSLEERTPDESTLRKTRQRLPEALFDAVFPRVLDQCQAAGLLPGRVIGTDSTLLNANASMDSLRHKELGCTYEEYVLALRRQDQPDATREEAQRADRQRGAGKASNEDWESRTDPEARVMQHADGHTALSYRADTAVDLESGVIVTAGAAFAHVSDQADFLGRVDEAQVSLAERGRELLGVVADKGHHSGENLAGLEERGLCGLVSQPRRPTGAPGFERVDFVYDAESDTFRCPAGQVLRRMSRDERGSRRYQARGSDCRGCPHFGVCTQSPKGRRLKVPMHAAALEANRERVHTPAYRPLLQIRRQRGEAPFGYFKQYGGLRRLAGRGLAHAQKKVLIAAAGWNLLRLLSGRRPGLWGFLPDTGPGRRFSRTWGRAKRLVGLLRALAGRRRGPGALGPCATRVTPFPRQNPLLSGAC
jgi:transposase